MTDGTPAFDLAEAQRQLRPMWDRIARAERQLAETSGRAWYFALLGFKADFDEHPVLGDMAYVRRVAEPPDPMFLQFAADSSYAASATSRYSRGVTYELVLREDDSKTEEQHFTLAWQIVSAVRLSSLAELLVPAASDYPWGTIPGVKNNRVRIRPVEDVPRAHVLTPGIRVTADHLDWVRNHFIVFMDLIELPRFRLASEALTTHHLQHGERMMAANVWVGIEALVDVQTELRFRLSAFAAAILEPPGEARRQLYKRVQKLYDVRSKVVHGAVIDSVAIRQHTIEARAPREADARMC